MGKLQMLVVTLAVATHAFAAPQLLTFGKSGSVGVNFGGYHASAGLGGLLGGGGTGGLFAEAGTPHGQEAKAGLGGVTAEGGSSGGLYAGATAGGGVRAAAGLEGEVSGGSAAGGVYSGAQAGGHHASAGLAGETSNAGSSGFTYSSHNSFGVADGVKKVETTPVVVESVKSVQPAASYNSGFSYSGSFGASGGANAVKEVEVAPVVQTIKTHQPAPSHNSGFSYSKSFGASGGTGTVKEVETAPVVVETIKSVQPVASHTSTKHKKVTTVEEETVNYIQDVPPPPPPAVIKTVAVVPHVKTERIEVKPVVTVHKHFDVKTEAHTPVVYKEVYSAPPVYYKPRHHHKTWVGGYFGANAGAGAAAAAPAPTKVVYKEVQAPVIQKRVDVVAESAADANVGVHTGGDVVYRKSVNIAHRNPTFFSDIFNIPISTLNAVGKFLGNAAGSTSITVDKQAYVHADGEGGKDLSSGASVSVQTPSATSFIDDVLAIPINTLGAVNKFLENNVKPRSKSIQVETSATSGDEAVVPLRIRGHGRRRAARKQILVQQDGGTSGTQEAAA